MSGQEMYELYQGFHADHGCGVDDWGTLDEREQAAWNFLAEKVQP